MSATTAGELAILRKLTRVVGTANGNLLGQSVLDLNATSARNANLLRQLGVGQVELAVLALEATNRLAGGALGAGPLGLLVTGRTSIGAHRTIPAGVTEDSSDNVTDHLAKDGHVLNARPATKSKVVEGNSTVFRGERVTVKHAIREVTVDARADGAGARAGSRSGRRAARRAGSR